MVNTELQTKEQKMTDRELLEMAAKAASILHKWNNFWKGFYIQQPDGSWDSTSRWCPLIDDGEALRLAVMLELEIYHGDSCGVTEVYVGYVKYEFDRIRYCVEQHDDDKYAATRRAIVRAAAEIGKAMK